VEKKLGGIGSRSVSSALNDHKGHQAPIAYGLAGVEQECLYSLSLEEFREREIKHADFIQCSTAQLDESEQAIIKDAKAFLGQHRAASPGSKEYRLCDQIYSWSIPLRRMAHLVGITMEGERR